VTDLSGTVCESFAASATRWPDRPFLAVTAGTAAAYGIAPREYTYGQVAVEVAGLRSGYRQAGFAHGDRAGLLLFNRPEFLVHWLAFNALGVSVVPINPDWRAEELAFLVGHSEIRAAVAPTERHAALEAAARSASRPLALLSPDGGGPAALPDDPKPRERPAAAREAPSVTSECALLYTSGTTGVPKGCILPNEYFLWAGHWYAGLGGLCEIRPGAERMITPLPLTHMNAMACSAMCMMLTGGCLIAVDRFHPGSWWHSVRESRATVMHYLGVMPAMLLSLPPSSRDREHGVRFGFGAGVQPRHHAAFEDRFGVPLIEAWAMTETGAGGAVIASREPRQVGTACFGRPDERIEYRLVDPEDRDVPAGEPGELLVRRRGDRPRFGFFAGYLKDEAATTEAWHGGWLHTGDLVRAGEGGQLHFVDRRKNLIRRSGENISAMEVEGVLLQHPAVAAVGVIAVPDEIRGDEVMACVVLKRESATPADEGLARQLVEFCLARLAYYKAPGYVSFCGSLPLTPTEKIQRGQLNELGRRLLDDGACVDTRTLKKRSSA
jgi:acyl-CoA synthetase (AMP-forming)/AMP-acid ligase II